MRSISPKSQYIYPSFYKFLQGLFSFYDSKTSKPHASQSYGSGALCDLMVADFADFWFVTEYAIKSAILHFGCVTIKMARKWGNERRSLSRLGNKIYIVDKHIFYGTG